MLAGRISYADIDLLRGDEGFRSGGDLETTTAGLCLLRFPGSGRPFEVSGREWSSSCWSSSVRVFWVGVAKIGLSRVMGETIGVCGEGLSNSDVGLASGGCC